jgi:glycosyltransferase involved in cell wall biosynthesis
MNQSMKNRPLVSAIVATYNRSDIVSQAIESILAQTYDNIEVIVVDDGSTDGTQDSLLRYGNRIRVVRQENAGPAAARNRGIVEARGEIVSFLDSDDIWLPTFVERQVSVLERAGPNVPCSIANSWFGYATGTGTTSFQISHLRPAIDEGIWLNPAEVLVTRFLLFSQTVAIRRSALMEAGLFDEGLWYLEDYDLREPLVVWRQSTADSLSQKGANKRRVELVENRVKIYENILKDMIGDKGLAGTHASLTRALKQAYVDLRAERLGEKNRWGSGTMAKSIHLARNLRGYLYRRSSSFPQMRIAPFSQPPLNNRDTTASLSAPQTT